MDSNKKDNINFINKNIFSLILIIALNFILQFSFVESTFANDRTREEIYLEIYKNNEVSEEPLNIFEDNADIIASLLESEAIEATSESVGYQDFKNSYTRNQIVDGFALTIDNDIFGYILSRDQKDQILENVCDLYIEELGLNKKDVHYIEASGDIEIESSKVSVAEIESESYIAEEIYNKAVKDKEVVDLVVNVKIGNEEDVPAPIVYKEDNSIYMGEIVEQNGEGGKKEVYTSITYNGLEKVSEELAEEVIIVEPVPTVIYKGMKNPYNDGIAFLNRPVTGGDISSYYGEVRTASVHKGIDIAEDIGTCVEAALYGTVVSAGYNYGGYGNLVVIEHDNNMKTYYAHLDDIYVKKGQEVSTEDVIGTVGNTGFSTGPHLHFELRVDNGQVNPLKYIIK